jgi:SAM-dependent methyltransferase
MVECTRSSVKLAPEEKVRQDYDAMAPWLPESVSSILDIGCGYAHIDDYLLRHYGGAGLDLHLLDGDEDIQPIAKERTGYLVKTPRPWRNRNVAIERLQKAFPECRVHGHPADPSLTIPCDLIISRRSWGHHYPIKAYIGLADRSLRPGGRIITDIRLGRGRDSDNLEAFRSCRFKIIAENIEVRSMKCRRIVLGR